MSGDALRYIAAGDIAVRADAEGDGRTVSGYAYRWGELAASGSTVEYGELAEGFAPGAFAPAIAARGGRPWPLLDRHRGSVVGGVTFTEDEIGLRYEGRLLDTMAARDYAATIPAGNDGVSLEFMFRGATSRRQGKAIIHTAIPKIAALAGVYVPAYEGATVALREAGGNGTMTDTIETIEGEPTAERMAQSVTAAPVASIGRQELAALIQDGALEVMRAYAERGALTTARTDPLAGYASLGHLFLAAAQPGVEPELRAYAARALADTVFTAGANAGLASGNLITDDIKRIVDRGRPAITAFGGPKPLGDSAGLTLEWAYFDGTLSDYVAAQSAEKAEIESAAVDIKLATEALVTYAGGSDISYQLIRRGRPSILDAFARIVLAAWAAVTDAAFVTELETGTATVDLAEAITAVDLTELTSHLITASLAVEAATGRPAEFVLASTTAFTKAAQLIAPSQTTVVAGGTMDLRGLQIGIGGLPIIHVAGVTAGKLIASNELAAAWYEDGPFQASAEDVSKLGRNVAYWSMGAGARFIPAGVIEIYDVTP
jgi:HK97 family phage prohead protease